MDSEAAVLVVVMVEDGPRFKILFIRSSEPLVIDHTMFDLLLDVGD